MLPSYTNWYYYLYSKENVEQDHAADMCWHTTKFGVSVFGKVRSEYEGRAGLHLPTLVQ